jgi:hypothetical protein
LFTPVFGLEGEKQDNGSHTGGEAVYLIFTGPDWGMSVQG